MISRREFLFASLAIPLVPHALGQRLLPAPISLVNAARAQIGVTTTYDPAYVRLTYPGGDIPLDRGVCIDVIIRAYREAVAFDFQQAVHEDMRAAFGAYPKIWGLTRPDRNIDHRRVPNIETWLRRHGYERLQAGEWMPGDIMTCRLPGNLPHAGLVSDRRNRHGTPLLIHNIGRGTEEEDVLGLWTQERQFRFYAV